MYSISYYSVRHYIAWFLEHLDFRAELQTSAVYDWFRQAGFRPEVLGAAVDALVFDMEVKPGQYAQRLEQLVQGQIEASNAEALRVVHSLTPLQSAVLRVMALSGVDYAPFEQQTMERYKAILAAVAPDYKVAPDTANVQQALVALQEKALVWRAARGIYALEDSFLTELMQKAGLLAPAAIG